MPIYAYKCSSCAHELDVLQKLSDPPLTVCPGCGQQTFSKQLTAAGFQLKGSGWYATDFKNGSGKAPSAAKPAGVDKPASADKPAESAGPAKDAGSAPAPACGAGGCTACS